MFCPAYKTYSRGYQRYDESEVVEMFCRECGFKLAETAKYCEQCGAPVSVLPGVSVVASPSAAPNVPAQMGNRSVRSSLPRWVYAALPALFVVGVAVGLAVGLLVGLPGTSEEPVVGQSASRTGTVISTTTGKVTSTLVSSSSLPSTTSEALSVTSTTLAPTTTAKPPTTSTWPNYITEWPSGHAGWTVQVAKFDGANPFSEEWAAEKAEAVLADRLPAGILYSSDFSSIQEGWWVVFSGVFSSKSAAQSHRNKVIAKGYSEAVVIQVVPK